MYSTCSSCSLDVVKLPPPPFSPCWRIPTHSVVSPSLHPHWYGETLLGKWERQSPQRASLNNTCSGNLRIFSLWQIPYCVHTLTWMEAERVGEIFKASKEVQLMDEPCSQVLMGRKLRAQLSLEAFTDIHTCSGSRGEPVRATQGVRSLCFISTGEHPYRVLQQKNALK